MQNLVQENKMGVMPVNKLLLTMAVPMMLSTLSHALYNTVDSIFVSRLSENALTAVSLAAPYHSLMLSVGVGTVVGVTALLSRSLGEKKLEMANKAAMNGLFLAGLSFLVFFLLGLTVMRPYFAFQTDVEEIIDYGVRYLSILSMASIGMFSEIIFERLLQATGRTVYTMASQLVGSIVNLVLDPILIFGVGSFRGIGITGAAVATVLGQFASSGLALFFNWKLNTDLRLDFRRFRPDGAVIKAIYAVGVPSIVMNAIGSLSIFLVNRVLESFTVTAVAVLGIYFKVQNFFTMAIASMNNAVIPIAAYNYGARNKARLLKIIQLAFFYAVLIMLAGVVVLQLFPGPLLRLFDASAHMLSIGIPALRIISLCFVFAGFNIIACAAFQALRCGVRSMLVSLVRQFVLLPTAWLLSMSGQLVLVWICYPIAEASAIVLSIFFLCGLYRRIIRPMDQTEPRRTDNAPNL